MTKVEHELGSWLSAALEDPTACHEFKIAVENWMKEVEERDSKVKYGCHCDLEEGMEPDACVLDEGNENNCIYATRLRNSGKTKHHCEYWRPVSHAEVVS